MEARRDFIPHRPAHRLQTALHADGFDPPPPEVTAARPPPSPHEPPMARPFSVLARPAAIPAGAGLRLRRLLSLPEAPFAALAAPCADGQLFAGLTVGSAAIRYGIEAHR